MNSNAAAQEVKIWEFSPYDVQIWYDIDPSVPMDESSQQQFFSGLRSELERTFRAAWDVAIDRVPNQMQRHVTRDLPNLIASDLARSEYSLVVSTTHEQSKTIRTFNAAADSINSFMVSASAQQAIQAAARQLKIADDSPAGKVLSKLEVVEETDQAIIEKLKAEQIAAALLPREFSEAIDKTRLIATELPWQSDRYLAHKDKIFFVMVSMVGDLYQIQVREMDCPMLHMGPLYSATTDRWSQLPRISSLLLQRSFAPVARVESAETFTAELRHRAGGLIVDNDADGFSNPARIQVGDVLYPIIRRDDRNGNPALLQVLNFTYCAVTESDGVKMLGNVYAYSGGPGLQGRQNRRTQRMLLRVRPTVENSDLRIVVRGNADKSQPGCFVYTKDFLTDQFDYVGRTDWRGRVSIPLSAEEVRVLPDALRVQRAEALRAAKKEATEKAAKEYEEALKKAEEAGEKPPTPPDSPVIEAPPIDPTTTVKLNSPLAQLYVKSGDTVLAKLPYVPGLHEVDTAELQDDTLRLQTEAFVRGFQGEVLDLIGLRNLLAARAKLLIKDGKLDKAAGIVEELRSLKDFNQMNDQLSQLERSILEQYNAGVPRSAQSQIDRMFKTTRDMLQKYLQEDIGSKVADQLRNAGTAVIPEPAPEASSSS